MSLDFPASPGSLGQIYGQWQWDGTKWIPATGSSGGGGIPDAPSNNVGYGRYNAAWTPVLMLAGDILDGGNF